MVGIWLGESTHPLLALGIVLVLEAGAMGGLVWWAGWRNVWHALAVENTPWFALCGGGQVVAYFGYTLALRRVAAVDEGVELDLFTSFAIVSIGFAPVFSANTAGGFSIDRATLREAGMSRTKSFVRVLALSALEYAVLAPAVAVCGLLLFFHVGGQVSGDIALPWLGVIPGAAAAAWLTSPKRAERQCFKKRAGRLGRGFAHLVAALVVLRRLITEWRNDATGLLGAALYWVGDIVTLWAALRVFDVRLSVPAVVLAYGTGWALTRRSLPLGGPGLVEVLLAYVLTWFHVRFGAAAAGVVAYRLFNFWLALAPAALVLPFAKRFQRKLAEAAVT